MACKAKLTSQMSVDTFDNNYWYAAELKAFAKEIGLAGSSPLRKDQLERSIKNYLQDGTLLSLTSTTSRKTTNTPKDYEISPLSSETIIKNYCSNKISKDFIQSEAKRRQPNIDKKSGAWYWLNRWREEQKLKELSITYGDLVEHFMVLCNTKDRLPRIPSTKFNNFISDFLAANAGSRSDATKAWETLKTLDCPKTYNAWLQQKNKATNISAATSQDS